MKRYICIVCVVVTTAAAWGKDRPASLLLKDEQVILWSDGYELHLSWGGVTFDFEGCRIELPRAPEAKSHIEPGTRIFESAFAPKPIESGGQLEACVLYESPPLGEDPLRKWVRFRVTGRTTPLLLREVVLESIPLETRVARTLPGEVQSYPVFLDGFFAGVEFPVASTRVENNTLIVAHRPGWTIQPDTWYETRKAVFGWAKPGGELRAFKRYLMGHRPPPSGIHVNYNSWWTSSCPYYTE
ncbi:MAG: hypothetical protein NTU83_13310, partial [Candidatus Hydrogenedentes bacterium]|nr:hypothetical protein [Candidatus Hydrogenedentota bacterium]